MSNEDRDSELYTYPDSNVLRNKLDIRDAEKLARWEARLVENRIEEGPPGGSFDQKHLCAIHRHLFQDVYEWAGEFRQVDIAKGESWFHPHERLEMGMADIHKRLSAQDFLRNLEANVFAREAAEFIGDVNRLHPFREGNGRTQLQYLRQLGDQAGHSMDLTRFERDTWIQASIDANQFKSERMVACIRAAIDRPEQHRADQTEPQKTGPSHRPDFEALKEKAQDALQKREQSQEIDDPEQEM